VYNSSQGCHTAVGTHIPYVIMQCYLPPGRGDIPAVIPARGDWKTRDHEKYGVENVGPNRRGGNGSTGKHGTK